MNDRAGALSTQLIGTLQGVQAQLEAAVEPLGLSLAKFGMLARLVDAGEPLPLSTLAERSMCVRSNVTQLVDRLEAEGLVRRAPDPRDRRSIRAELTESGRTLHAEALKALAAAEERLYGGLTPEAREQLVELLNCLKANTRPS
jgi:DNA-binding MarR family transcriptional regulator